VSPGWRVIAASPIQEPCPHLQAIGYIVRVTDPAPTVAVEDDRGRGGPRRPRPASAVRPGPLAPVLPGPPRAGGVAGVRDPADHAVVFSLTGGFFEVFEVVKGRVPSSGSLWLQVHHVAKNTSGSDLSGSGSCSRPDASRAA